MSLWRAIPALLSILAFSACGGSIELACDDIRLYQQAAEGKRVQAPEDLDDLDTLKEIPLPKASPAPPRPPGSPCIDRPPSVGSAGS